ncbi:MAG: LamG domain-containing protein [Thermoguttaceae bacterium]
MKQQIFSSILLSLFASYFVFLISFSSPIFGADKTEIMPEKSDYTLMYWAEGFPSHLPNAPWHRVIQTGQYAFVLDTEKLTVPHFGALSETLSYNDIASNKECDAKDALWKSLPPAELSLRVRADGPIFRANGGGKWTHLDGPRLIESGQFLQRADVTNIPFVDESGKSLNAKTRFETVALPDKLGFRFAVKPDFLDIPEGESCFGRIGGGFGLTGSNHLDFPHSKETDPQKLTFECWIFVPEDYASQTKTFPWIVCKNNHEEAVGNYGIAMIGGQLTARINVLGGRENQVSISANQHVIPNTWYHIAISYDDDIFRFFVNGTQVGEKKIGHPRTPGKNGLAIGRRQDNCPPDGYHFRGVVDEIRIYDRALSAAEIGERFKNPDKMNPELKPIFEQGFDSKGMASMTRPSAEWKNAALEIKFTTPNGSLSKWWKLPAGQTWSSETWNEVVLFFDPVLMQEITSDSPLDIEVTEIPSGSARPVSFDSAVQQFRINIDGVEPQLPSGDEANEDRAKWNNSMERFKIRLKNPTNHDEVARLLFDKTSGGFRQKIGASITGISAVLRDKNGEPTGVPVQLSKNWHGRPESGVYAGQWFHGITQVRVPAGETLDLEFSLVYGKWGGVPAVSHAQLCLIGWGSNQQWDESALGSWGESICYEPDRIQAAAAVLDVRPCMVSSMNGNTQWNWTNNVGGADFFRLFDTNGKRIPPNGMKTVFHRQSPCLTEVTYIGKVTDGITHSETVSLGRTDDIVRGTYRLRMDVTKPTEFSRFVLFQVGADSYNYTAENKMAVGNELGITKEWKTQWGGDENRTEPMECSGKTPWISLHDAVARRDKGREGAWANRGIVIRSWNAKLGGKEASPWMVEHGVEGHGKTSSADIVPPPGVTKLLPGDFVECEIEHLVIPISAADYYGSNQELKNALEKDANTAKMVLREATGNQRVVETKIGSLLHLYPDVAFRASSSENKTAANKTEDAAVVEAVIRGGIGYIPVTFSGLDSPDGFTLFVDAAPLDQSRHGNDYWQTDYDSRTKTWSRTYNIPVGENGVHSVRLSHEK